MTYQTSQTSAYRTQEPERTWLANLEDIRLRPPRRVGRGSTHLHDAELVLARISETLNRFAAVPKQLPVRGLPRASASTPPSTWQDTPRTWRAPSLAVQVLATQLVREYGNEAISKQTAARLLLFFDRISDVGSVPPKLTVLEDDETALEWRAGDSGMALHFEGGEVCFGWFREPQGETASATDPSHIARLASIHLSQLTTALNESRPQWRSTWPR